MESSKNCRHYKENVGAKDPQNHYEDSAERLSDVVVLYGEMLFPSTLSL